MKNKFLIVIIMISMIGKSFGQISYPSPPQSIKSDEKGSSNIVTMNDKVFDELITPIKPVPLDSNAILIYDMNGVLNSFNLKTKTINWTVKATDADRITSGNNKFHVVDGVVYIPFVNGEIFALSNQTGKLFWKNRLGRIRDEIVLKSQSAQIVDGSIFITAQYNNQNIYAIDAKNGKMRWNYKLQYPYNHIPNLVFNGKVFAPNAPYLHSFDAKTGKALYRRGFKKAMYGKPVTDGKNVFIANESDSLFAVAPDNLDILWAFKLDKGQYDILDKIFVKEKNIYTGTQSSNTAAVYCINAENGKGKWKSEFEDDDIVEITQRDQSLWGYTKKGVLFELDLQSGEKKTSTQLVQIPLSNLEFLNDNELFFYSGQGLIKLDLTSKKEELLLEHHAINNFRSGDSYIKLLTKKNNQN